MGIRKLDFLASSNQTVSFTYANVFPLPVTASTTTSEFFINIGIAACCTGVVFTKPMASTASMIHSDNAGVSALNDLSIFV